ncbi:hypothetical protein KO495_12020 [Colwellia sp. D2M02]|uniref:hypothetical protein n=1 Tax=Colwellia sp. D2M02 TaxID=2841562 RepID=UPI001C0A667B|nr:hypothetical protein [Colwellia sp. D2M02]MBU2894038.1 hypothetical protein [Colwellia sp. D2M02]
MNSITFNHSRLASYATIIAATFLTGCVNQNKLAEQTLAPISNPCQKITMLANAYKTNFETLKQSEVKSRASNIWQAKYHLVGNNCKIWSFGANNATYSCNTIEVEQQSAQKYYQNAKETIQQCLGDDWRLTESKRNHDDGLKAEYVNEINDLTISTHLVPSTGVFKSKWSVYYYIGNVDR